MRVSPPLFIQVLLSGGDRFLAANVTVFRALTLAPEHQDANRLSVQARIQKDAVWLNPYHEDNYYLAAAGLSWNNHLDEAQHILKRASHARSFDMLPPFYFAFNEYYFNQNPTLGAQWLKIASSHTTNLQDKMGLQRLASNWIVKGKNRKQAHIMLKTLAEQSHYSILRKQTLQRAKRVEHLIALDEAIAAYKIKFHTPPKTLEQLVTDHIIDALPIDPLGSGYTIDSEGVSQIMDIKKNAPSDHR